MVGSPKCCGGCLHWRSLAHDGDADRSAERRGRCSVTADASSPMPFWVRLLTQLTDELDGVSCDAFVRRSGWDPSRWLSDRRAAARRDGR